MTDATAIRNPNLVTGVLKETSEDRIVLAIPETSYQISLSVYKPVSTPVGKRITGTIRAQAMRIDTVKTGGRFIDPVYGRPRRVQGVITAIDASERTVTINAGVPVVCKTDVRQKPGDFTVGDFVACSVQGGASFSVSV
ncbi:MAG: hypothetical protein RLN60_04590 [Phycisphaerales bacterium]